MMPEDFSHTQSEDEEDEDDLEAAYVRKFQIIFGTTWDIASTILTRGELLRNSFYGSQNLFRVKSQDMSRRQGIEVKLTVPVLTISTHGEHLFVDNSAANHMALSKVLELLLEQRALMATSGGHNNNRNQSKLRTHLINFGKMLYRSYGRGSDMDHIMSLLPASTLAYLDSRTHNEMMSGTKQRILCRTIVLLQYWQ
jgi:hypothetical protein